MYTFITHNLDENEVSFSDDVVLFNGNEANYYGNMRDFEEWGDILGFLLHNEKKEYWLFDDAGETYVWW